MACADATEIHTSILTENRMSLPMSKLGATKPRLYCTGTFAVFELTPPMLIITG